MRESHCSGVIEPVRRGRAPVEEDLPSRFGFARRTITVHGDLLEPTDEAWEAAQ